MVVLMWLDVNAIEMCLAKSLHPIRWIFFVLSRFCMRRKNDRMISCYCGRINVSVKSCAQFFFHVLFFSLQTEHLCIAYFRLFLFDATFVSFFVAFYWFVVVMVLHLCDSVFFSVYLFFQLTHLHMVLSLTLEFKWSKSSSSRSTKKKNYLPLPSDLFSIVVAVMLSCWCIIFSCSSSLSTVFRLFRPNWHNTCRNGMFLIFLYILRVDFLFLFLFHVGDAVWMCTLTNAPFSFRTHSNVKNTIYLIEFFIKMRTFGQFFFRTSIKFIRLKWMTHKRELQHIQKTHKIGENWSSLSWFSDICNFYGIINCIDASSTVKRWLKKHERSDSHRTTNAQVKCNRIIEW